MDKTVGKLSMRIYSYFFLLCSLFFTNILICSQMHLKLITVDGNVLDKAVVGQPFLLEVTISNSQDSQNKPTIAEQENISIKNFGIHMISINGVSTITHRYRVRIDATGTYTLGPAQFNANGTTLESNAIKIQVVEQSQVPASTSKKASQNTGAFLRLTTDKDRVVIGQKITCSLRFYYSDDVTNLAPINQQKLTGFSAPGVMKTNRGIEKINGKEYNYLEVSWDMIPIESGKKVIPAYYADYTVRSASTNLMAHLSMFLNGLGEQKRVYSNAITINVDPLPTYKGEVHGVGSFSQFNARIEPAVAKQGEGIVFTLELEGEGTLEKKHTVLGLKVPESFKYYDSKNYSTQSPSGNTKQHFEYIVQGLEKGTFEIPSQEFTFFDIERRKYKTLHTQPLSVTILPGGLSEKQKIQNEQTTDTPIKTEESLLETRPLKWSVQTDRFIFNIPWWLFVFIALIPLVTFLYSYKKNQLFQRLSSSKHYVFKKTKTTISKAFKNKQYARLYPSFIELFSSIFKIPESELTQDTISRLLKQSGITEEEIPQWNQFFNQISEYSFYNKQPTLHEINALENYSFLWLNKFENIL